MSSNHRSTSRRQTTMTAALAGSINGSISGSTGGNTSSSGGSSHFSRYHYPMDESLASYPRLSKSVATKPIQAANTMMGSVGEDKKDSYEILKRRHIMNQNLEELISLVIQENEGYKNEVYRLRNEILVMHDLLRQRENELVYSAEEKSLVTEAELTRVLKEHSDIVKQCKIYQEETLQVRDYNTKLEQHLKQCAEEAVKLKTTMIEIGKESESIKEKLDQVRKNNRVLELAYDEVIQYRRERVVREIAFPTNPETEISKLRAELYAINEKVKELENENTILKADRQSIADNVTTKASEIQKIQDERKRSVDVLTTKLQDAEKAKQALEMKVKALENDLKKMTEVDLSSPPKHPIAVKAEKRASVSLNVLIEEKVAHKEVEKAKKAISPAASNPVVSDTSSNTKPSLGLETPGKVERSDSILSPRSPTAVLLQQIAAKAGKEPVPLKNEDVDFLDLSMNDISSYF